MAKTYTQIQQQIAKLQKEADAVKTREVPGVIGRIKDAIGHYGLTPQDLFGPASASAASTAPAASASASANSVKRTSKAASPKKPADNKPATQRRPSVPKYQDGAGRTWTGNGKRPGWFLAAIESGKTPQDLAIKP